MLCQMDAMLQQDDALLDAQGRAGFDDATGLAAPSSSWGGRTSTRERASKAHKEKVLSASSQRSRGSAVHTQGAAERQPRSSRQHKPTMAAAPEISSAPSRSSVEQDGHLEEHKVFVGGIGALTEADLYACVFVPPPPRAGPLLRPARRGLLPPAALLCSQFSSSCLCVRLSYSILYMHRYFGTWGTVKSLQVMRSRESQVSLPRAVAWRGVAGQGEGGGAACAILLVLFIIDSSRMMAHEAAAPSKPATLVLFLQAQ